MAGIIMPYRGVRPTIAPTAFIATTATVIGDVEIAARSGIWFGCVVRGDVNEIRIGEDTNIQDGTIIHVSKDGQGTYIGDRVTIGHMVLLHACTLEAGCFIGMHATVMDDCVVEPEGMLAAGALLTPGKRVRSGELWAGSPAKRFREVGDQERAVMARTIPRYVGLAEEYRSSEDGDAGGRGHG
jgi:carbonic anhydrase/acetyltransferase-like protein (isoleucine patch superfamily)